MTQKSPTKIDPLAKKKSPSKPKVRYFRFNFDSNTI